jgi:uncharacterized protein (UPF0248 family)
MATSEVSSTSASFLNRFLHYIRIDFSCKQLDEENPHELAQALRQQSQTLCKALTSREGSSIAIHIFPTLLTTCEADAVISHDAGQDRGTILLGLEGIIDQEAISETLREWQDDVRTSTLFIDYIPVPSLTSRLVRKEDLGHLIVDHWIYPWLHDEQIMIYSKTGIAHQDHSITSPPIASKAGSSVAAAAACRSPFPGMKKLTPISAILNRLRWDDAFDSKDFVVVYEDRHAGLMESPVASWTTESTEETFIPMHRIRAVAKKSTGMTVWHREERIDLISSTEK